jgi:hypothetical protein
MPLKPLELREMTPEERKKCDRCLSLRWQLQRC